MKELIYKLSVATSVGMYLVLLMGALVTQTDSGRGCGKDWPLCNGKFVPAYTVESLIEYSHRFVTGLITILVLAVFLLVLLKVKRREAKWYASAILFFTLVQAVMGAAAVMWPQSSAVLALHFGISLLAFISTFLLVMVLREERTPANGSGGMNLGEASSGRSRTGAVAANSAAGFRSGAVATASVAGFRTGVWLVLLYCYAVVYLGAFVRHTHSSGGCSGWPLCNGEWLPALSGASGIVFMHRLAALLLLCCIAVLPFTAKRTGQTEQIRRVSCWAVYFILLQIASGGFVTFSLGSDWYLLASLLHTTLICCLFAALSYLVMLVQRRPAGRTAG